MAGHSHLAGIKHKKGRADKVRSKIFSKLSREITVAAKLGVIDPDMNARLRSAIQSARSANIPKENIQRAIKKSENSTDSNYEVATTSGWIHPSHKPGNHETRKTKSVDKVNFCRPT